MLEVDLTARLVGEALVATDALERDPDVELVRELRSDAAGRLARRARPERLTLDEETVATTGPGQVVERARAHDPAADDDHLRACRDRHRSASIAPVNAALLALLAAGGVSAAIWLAVLLDPARAWDLRPVGEDEPPPPEPVAWPRVAVIVPARNEAAQLPETLPALLAQEYPGVWDVVLVDDRSTDATADRARSLAAPDGRLTVLAGNPLPDGWAGKVWALEQGCTVALRREPPPRYLLLTDADIRHAPRSARRLVAESEALGLALNSRMARLRTVTAAERLLIPPFVFFFNLLYPMRRVNAPTRRLAAAAGGCVLVRADALERAGGLKAISGEVIDDVNLARRVKALGEPIRLATSRADVVSVREYGSLGAVWRMVRRTAFDQLRYSWLLLAATLVGLLLLFPLPPALVGLSARPRPRRSGERRLGRRARARRPRRLGSDDASLPTGRALLRSEGRLGADATRRRRPLRRHDRRLRPPPPAGSWERVVRRDTAVIDGIALEYEESGAGEPVVCIHGAFVADAFRPLLAERSLASRYRLIAYHRRGYAGSSGAEGTVSLAQQAEDCRRLLSQLGVEPPMSSGTRSAGSSASSSLSTPRSSSRR